jgi:type IX secretion system substrate protein
MSSTNFFLSVFLVVTTAGLKAQDAVPATGGDATGSGGSAAYSTGQVICTSYSGTGGSVNQGVQQPYVFITTETNTQSLIELLMSVYPNPSVTSVYLKIENQDLQQLSFQLMDIQGKLILQQKITETETFIKMDETAAGTYFLKVTDNNIELKTFKIIKN